MLKMEVKGGRFRHDLLNECINKCGARMRGI